MRRVIKAGFVLGVLLTAACDNTSQQALPSGPVVAVTANSSLVPGTCTSKATLTSLINTAFGAGSPNARSALGKLDNLDRQVKKGNYADARAQAYSLVDFLLKKYKQGGFPGSAAQFAEIMRLVFCYAGLDFGVTDPLSSAIIYPSDLPQVLKSSDQLAGVQLPANPVSEPTLVTITTINPALFPTAGTGPLITKLDQYPGYVNFSKRSDTDAPLTQPVTVGVCPATGIPTAVRERLRLGHQARAGFEITPPASVDFLTCPTATASSGLAGFARTVASLFIPKDLYAASLVGGGVGGLASEFSPFGPVDVLLSVGGGVGGLPSEFIRAAGSSLESGCAASVEAPIGTPVPVSCRPTITVSTHLGTLFTGVPVSFAVELGGGIIAPDLAGACGTFGTLASRVTDLWGSARVCWTLGSTPGLNTVRASVAAGGDAPAGVRFAPAGFLFSATANPPVGIRFDEQPAEGRNAVSGDPVTVRASVVDKNDVAVMGFNGTGVLYLNHANFSEPILMAEAVVERGAVTFAGVSFSQPGTGYQFIVSVNLPGGAVTRVGNSFNIIIP